jgi:hypothetical protein
MRLAHQVVAADRVPLATLVAGDHVRGHAAGAHQQRERRGVVAAEAGARVEQELVDRLGAEALRRERVGVAAIAQVREHRGDEGALVGRGGAQFARQGERARVALARQRQVHVPHGGRQRAGAAVLRARGERVVEHLPRRPRQRQLVVGCQQRLGRQAALGQLQRWQQCQRPGLELDAVLIAWPGVAQFRARHEQRAARAPGTAVEVVQHRSAPVARVARRCGAGEAHAHRRVVELRELGDRARLELVAQPGDRIARVRQRPERARQAREEQEQQQRQRRGQQQQARRLAQRRARGQRLRRARQRQQRRAAQHQLRGVQRQAPQGLGVQAGGEQQEQGAAGQEGEVARPRRLEELERAHRHQQRRAGGETVERAEGREHGECQRHQRGIARRPAGQLPAAGTRRAPAPGGSNGGDREHPQRRVVQVQQRAREVGREQQAQRRERHRGGHRGGAGARHAGCSASARRHNWRCTLPSAGASSVLPMRRP